MILCGGTINSPQLLMLSGIGDPDELQMHGIAVKVARPGVGKGLQDHATALMIYGRSDVSPLLRNMRADRLARVLAEAFMLGSGFATELPGGITGFVRSSADEPIPDIQLLFVSGSLAASPYLAPFRRPFADSFTCRIVLLRPQSRGTITLHSADPFEHPRIRQGMLSAAIDWQKLCKGIKIFRNIAKSKELAPFVSREIGPSVDMVTDEQLEAYTRKTAVTSPPSRRNMPHGNRG